MTFRHGLVLVAVLCAAQAATADDINDQILSNLAPSTATQPPSETPATGADAPVVTSIIVEADLWQRVRNGFALPAMDDEYVRRHENWYSSRPDYWLRMVNRSSRYLHFVVEEVEKRGFPSEIALLPMIESAYNPRAHSHASASGMWQFIPSTGLHYGLEQTWWYDGRRDVFAATRAALDYLGMLHDMFGDWQLALAAYNWGEGAVARAIARNQAKGLPTDYASLKMPAETRNYVPKLMAVRHLLAEPERFGLTLPPLENKPYLAVVTTTRHMDVEVAARLADMSVDEFLDLNPAYNQPVIAYKASRKLLVPLDRAALFTERLATAQDDLLSWQPYQVARGDTVESVAQRYGIAEADLQRINRMSGRRLNPGQLLLVPRAGAQIARNSVAPAQTPAPAATPVVVAEAPAPAAVEPVAATSPAPAATIAEAPAAAPALQLASADTPAASEAQPLLAAASPVATAVAIAVPEVPVDRIAAAEVREAPKRAAPTSHVVSRGDTAYSLAARYGMTVQELLAINGLKNGRLVAGQRLTLVARAEQAAPAAQRATSRNRNVKQYKVRSGDTAFSIARRFSVEPGELLRWNNLTPASVLRPGDSMTIYVARN